MTRPRRSRKARRFRGSSRRCLGDGLRHAAQDDGRIALERRARGTSAGLGQHAA